MRGGDEGGIMCEREYLLLTAEARRIDLCYSPLTAKKVYMYRCPNQPWGGTAGRGWGGLFL